jgi:hypothetical protein
MSLGCLSAMVGIFLSVSVLIFVMKFMKFMSLYLPRENVTTNQPFSVSCFSVLMSYLLENSCVSHAMFLQMWI